MYYLEKIRGLIPLYYIGFTPKALNCLQSGSQLKKYGLLRIIFKTACLIKSNTTLVQAFQLDIDEQLPPLPPSASINFNVNFQMLIRIQCASIREPGVVYTLYSFTQSTAHDNFRFQKHVFIYFPLQN